MFVPYDHDQGASPREGPNHSPSHRFVVARMSQGASASKRPGYVYKRVHYVVLLAIVAISVASLGLSSHFGGRQKLWPWKQRHLPTANGATRRTPSPLSEPSTSARIAGSTSSPSTSSSSFTEAHSCPTTTTTPSDAAASTQHESGNDNNPTPTPTPTLSTTHQADAYPPVAASPEPPATMSTSAAQTKTPSPPDTSHELHLRTEPLTVGQHLILGCSPLAGIYSSVPEAQATDTVKTALELGFLDLDTAPHYGLGLSEMRLVRGTQSGEGKGDLKH